MIICYVLIMFQRDYREADMTRLEMKLITMTVFEADAAVSMAEDIDLELNSSCNGSSR